MHMLHPGCCAQVVAPWRQHGSMPFFPRLCPGPHCCSLHGCAPRSIAPMKEGGKRTLIIPPELGYGVRGALIPRTPALAQDASITLGSMGPINSSGRHTTALSAVCIGPVDLACGVGVACCADHCTNPRWIVLGTTMCMHCCRRWWCHPPQRNAGVRCGAGVCQVRERRMVAAHKGTHTHTHYVW